MMRTLNYRFMLPLITGNFLLYPNYSQDLLQKSLYETRTEIVSYIIALKEEIDRLVV